MFPSKGRKPFVPEPVPEEGQFTIKSYIKRNSWASPQSEKPNEKPASARARKSVCGTGSIVHSDSAQSSLYNKAYISRPQLNTGSRRTSQTSHETQSVKPGGSTPRSSLKLQSQNPSSSSKDLFSPRSRKVRGSSSFSSALNIPEAIPEVVFPRRYSVSFEPTGYKTRLDLDGTEESDEFVYFRSPVRASDLVVPCSDTFEEVLKHIEMEQCRQDELQYRSTKG